ncbi:hypothetical protein [Saccharopolyspora dendranthemae]|uniref:hypothetical protein n=1 Tax=Saccharopolyspora dendranthemae TaxID=1181886 RepID=UPI0011A843CF|nr:hypothetical protein [Saccharopolyspora dendranthemae]
MLFRSLRVVAAAAFLGSVLAVPASASPAPPQNPALGSNGLSTMHGDSASSDTTPFAGPGTGPVESRRIPLGAACPTVLQGGDGFPQALCTKIVGRAPVAFLLDPATGEPVASLDLPKGSLLGGVYAYLDERDRMVAVDGNGDLLRIAHDRNGEDGAWRLFVEHRTPLDHVVSEHCGSAHCDSVTSLMPDFAGRVWFATGDAVVGFVDPRTGAVATTRLPEGERVDNSISTAPEGVAVTTSHAQYLLDGTDAPRVVWRQPYDRGPARKPGQLSWGSGATPTFFGPRTGTEYLAITDNAAEKENLIVYKTGSGALVCSIPVSDGTENSPIGVGGSVFVANTYGYPYPATPEGAGSSDPAWAPFTGGMSKVDVRDDGCDISWTNEVRSAAVPRFAGDGLIYTSERTRLGGFRYVAIDPNTGAVVNSHPTGFGFFADTLQMVGTITQDRVLYQGTVSGILRIAPK